MCDPSTSDCNLLTAKLPAVDIYSLSVSSRAATAALVPADRAAFEHLIGNALAETEAVRWATRTFRSRLRRFLVEGAVLNGTSSDVALTAAFAVHDEDAHRHTGYVGPDLSSIEHVLDSGNLRETWALVYVLTKTHYFTELLLALLSSGVASAEVLSSRLGMDAVAVAARHRLVVATRAMASPALRFAQGTPDFEFQPFESWVHFNFDARSHTGSRLWRGARHPRAGGCRGAARASDDPAIKPPLSPAELAYQCGAATPCTLRWQPGLSCFELPSVNWTLPSGEDVPGLAAAVSGTTANVLQMATLLGFSADERVVLRAAMLAWLLPQDEHSLFEVMLAAEPYVPEAYRTVGGLDGVSRPPHLWLLMLPCCMAACAPATHREVRGSRLASTDLGRLWPPRAVLRTRGGAHAFRGADTWHAIGRRLAEPKGQQLLGRMSEEAQRYVRGVLAEAGAAMGAVTGAVAAAPKAELR